VLFDVLDLLANLLVSTFMSTDTRVISATLIWSQVIGFAVEFLNQSGAYQFAPLVKAVDFI
jgi:hypothetical protein